MTAQSTAICSRQSNLDTIHYRILHVQSAVYSTFVQVFPIRKMLIHKFQKPSICTWTNLSPTWSMVCENQSSARKKITSRVPLPVWLQLCLTPRKPGGGIRLLNSRPRNSAKSRRSRGGRLWQPLAEGLESATVRSPDFENKSWKSMAIYKRGTVSSIATCFWKIE